MVHTILLWLQYGDYSLSKNPISLNLSYKTDLDFQDCFAREKAHLIAEFHKTDLDILGHSRKGKAQFHGRVNTVLGQI